MRFNYCPNSAPATLERLLHARAPERLRSPLVALAATLCIIATWWGLERHWLSRALAEERHARLRLESSRNALAKANVARDGLARLLILDGRLREIRTSGSAAGAALADIANRIPAHTWLTSLSRRGDGIDMTGQAEGMARLGETLGTLTTSAYVTNPTLIRATKVDRSGAPPLVNFEVRGDE